MLRGSPCLRIEIDRRERPIGKRGHRVRKEVVEVNILWDEYALSLVLLEKRDGQGKVARRKSKFKNGLTKGNGERRGIYHIASNQKS